MPYANRETRLAYLKEYRKQNPDTRQYADRKATYDAVYARNRAYVIEIKETGECADCGLSYPYFCMDFDHVRGTKIKSISQLVSGRVSIQSIDYEISKCDLVCAICHRMRTFERAELTSKEEF